MTLDSDFFHLWWWPHSPSALFWLCVRDWMSCAYSSVHRHDDLLLSFSVYNIFNQILIWVFRFVPCIVFTVLSCPQNYRNNTLVPVFIVILKCTFVPLFLQCWWLLAKSFSSCICISFTTLTNLFYSIIHNIIYPMQAFLYLFLV